VSVLVANGIRTHYERMPARNAGADPPVVVCVHGLGTDSLASFYLTLAAPLAAAGIEVITYDLRAHGRSDRPATGYRVSDFVADLDGLLDGLGIDRPVHLVGNSFGGTIAFSHAAQRPERVASIVSIEAEPATEPWSEKMRQTLDNTMKELAREEFFTWLHETFGAHHARLSRAAGKRLSATTMAADIPSGPLLDLDSLQSIRCPVLSILGGEGFQKDDLTALQEVLPRCRTEVLPEQDHSVLVESHRIVRELVLRWVAEHDLVALPTGTTG
jgi:pimeloyl-ACP methyl ester carboxylesterase